MGAAVDAQVFAEALDERLRAVRDDGAVVLHWLGQAGFVVSAGGRRLVIDPDLVPVLFRASADQLQADDGG